MNLSDAISYINDYRIKQVTTKKEDFEYEEVLLYVYEATGIEDYLVKLANHYYGKQEYNLAEKYYSKVIDLGLVYINERLGDIWYYGRTGKRDYEKAYNCYQTCIEAKTGYKLNQGEVLEAVKKKALIKIADMYKNGYYVKKNKSKYKKIINDLWNTIAPYFITGEDEYIYVELASRQAKLLEEEGKVDKALSLYHSIKRHLRTKLRFNRFFGDVKQMDCVINDIYRLSEFDPLDFSLYDLFYLLKEDHLVSFKYNNKKYVIESIKDDDNMAIKFKDKYYHNFYELILNGSIDNKSLSELEYQNKLNNWEINK